MHKDKSHFFALALLRTVGFVVTCVLMSPAGFAEAVDCVATVDGYSISEREYAIFVRLERALVAQEYFPGEPSVSKADWEAAMSDGGAVDCLARRALESVIKSKLRQIIFVRHGIINDAGYSTFLEDLNEENRRRAAVVALGEPIYGPRAYSEPVYYRHLNSLRSIALRDLLMAADKPVVIDSITVGHYEQVVDSMVERMRSSAQVRANAQLQAITLRLL